MLGGGGLGECTLLASVVVAAAAAAAPYIIDVSAISVYLSMSLVAALQDPTLGSGRRCGVKSLSLDCSKWMEPVAFYFIYFFTYNLMHPDFYFGQVMRLILVILYSELCA